MNKRLLALTVVMASLLAAGCARPKYLVRNAFIEGRNVKYILEPAASGQTASMGNNQKVQMYDFSVRVCDYGNADAETNCNTSLILSDVWPGSVY